MIELKNITTDRIIFASNLFTNEALDIQMSLKRNSVEDYQALKDLLESGKKVNGREFLKEKLQSVEERMAMDNEKGYEPQIFLTNGYGNVDAKSILKTEKKNKGGVLVYKSPAVCSSGIKTKVSNLTIHNLKHLLSHVTPVKGENALLSTFRGYGELSVERLINSLNFFEEQITRQAQETIDKDLNLFLLNGAEKKAIVEDEIKEIIEYLTDTADICVWGKLTPSQKRLLAESVHGATTTKHQTVKNNMIDLVTNYTTLSEIQDGVKTKTLDRFIITKK